MASINSISPNIRDFLLNRNLILADSITDNGMAGYGSGLGKPANIETPPNAVQPSEESTTLGEFYRNLNLVSNPYQSDDELEEIDINNQTVGNIGNLPDGTTPAPYGSKGINVEESILLSNSKEYRLGNTKFNQYLDEEKQYIINLLNQTGVSDQKSSYIDENNNLNTGGAVSDQPLNVAGSLLTGRGVGIGSQGNLEPNFDVRATLAGRALDASGVINDTPIGVIGGQQLGFHLGNTLASNLQQETIGNVNTNPLSLLQGNNIVVPNFDITVPQGQTGRVLDFGARVLGFELPVSILDNSSSIFSNENPVSNFERNNSIIKNTGKGQVLALFDNLLANESDGLLIRRYRPPYLDPRVEEGPNASDGIFPDLYVDVKKLDIHNKQDTWYNEPADLGSEFEGLAVYGVNSTDEEGEFEARSKFSWEDEKFNVTNKNRYFGDTFTETKGILYKTQQMFNTNRMRTLVSGKGSSNTFAEISEITTPVNVGGAQWTSKGSGVLSESAIQGELDENASADDIFCRVWTTFDRYNKIKDLQKSDGLFANAGLRFSTSQSVLDDNGMARISPKVGDEGPDDMKRFMLSIENLAWADKWSSLPDCEKGPGDPITGTRGRIMWFPPYDIDFTDNSAVNWDTTQFIGRGEPVYTYNNTERTGTLSFKVIIDHATYLNELKNRSDIDDQVLISIAAGCYELDGEVSSRLTQEERDEIAVKTAQNVEKRETPKAQTPPPPFSFYFPNDVATIPEPGSEFEKYESGEAFYTKPDGTLGSGLGCTKSEKFHGGRTDKYPDQTDFALNAQSYQFPVDPFGGALPQTYEGWLDSNFISAMKEYMKTQCPGCKVKIYAGTSKDGRLGPNQELGLARAASIRAWFEENIFPNDPVKDKRFQIVNGKLNVEQGCSKNTSCGREGIAVCNEAKNQCQDLECKKKARNADVSFEYSSKINEIVSGSGPTAEELENLALNEKIRSRFFSECRYFEKLEQNDSFIYESIKRKVRYFHPSFHSTTPEGFNSRLTFLKQCTRQGPTEGRDGIPSNLAFGVAPVCILRVGDFYHTKIVIDNVNLTFDPLVWDLNPEGVGVQPMICNVDLSFKFIGGSSLQGPINKLQNAVSFNFFGNTEIYDTRADKIEFKGDKAVVIDGKSPTQLEDTEEESMKEGLGSNNSSGEINQVEESEQITQSEPEEVETETSNTGDPITGELDSQGIVFGDYKPSNTGDLRLIVGTYSSGSYTQFWTPKNNSVKAFVSFNNMDYPLNSVSLNSTPQEEGDNLIKVINLTINISSPATQLKDIDGLSNDDLFHIKLEFENGIKIISPQTFCLSSLQSLQSDHQEFGGEAQYSNVMGDCF